MAQPYHLLQNNVLIDDDGRGLLTDFGLSRVIEELPAPSGNAQGGTIRWQGPELMFDAPEEDDEGAVTTIPPIPSPASDVWSFACTAYEVNLTRYLYSTYPLTHPTASDQTHSLRTPPS